MENIGFGTSKLAHSNNLNEAIKLLETAYGMGVRHFDTAPAYGFGNSEKILGKFIKNKRSKVTITSKCGLQTRHIPMIALPVLNAVRKPLKKLLSRKEGQPTINKALELTPIQIIRSLENSLNNLQIDYLDYFLLHEAKIGQANKPEIISTLLDAKKAGKIRHFGIGTYFSMIENDLKYLSSEYEVVQFNDETGCNFVNNADKLSERKIIRHGMFQNLRLAKKFIENHSKLNKLNPVDLCTQVFKHTSTSNTINLFSSSDSKNIKNSINFWRNPSEINEKIIDNFVAFIAKQS